MDFDRVVEDVRLLAHGVDPETRQEFPADSPYHRPRVIRALMSAAHALEAERGRRRRRRALPANAGAPWTEENDRRLVTGFDASRTIRDLAEEHQRTANAVKARLLRLGKIETDDLDLR